MSGNLNNLGSIYKIIDYCECVAKQIASVDSYSMSEIAKLAQSAKLLYKMDLNPLGRPVVEDIIVHVFACYIVT